MSTDTIVLLTYFNVDAWSLSLTYLPLFLSSPTNHNLKGQLHGRNILFDQNENTHFDVHCPTKKHRISKPLQAYWNLDLVEIHNILYVIYNLGLLFGSRSNTLETIIMYNIACK